jgi:hypothetical protein
MIEQLDSRFFDTQFVVKCSSVNEYECLKLKYCKSVSWIEDKTGLIQNIGSIQDCPIFLSFIWSTINGKRILFFACLSEVSDQVQIDDWLKENCRPRYIKGQKLAHCEAIKFVTCLNFCNDVVFEKDTRCGDIFETVDGCRFLVLPNKKQIYIGHKNLSLIGEASTCEQQPDDVCHIISHIELTYENTSTS